MLRKIAVALNQRVEIRYTDSAIGIACGNTATGNARMNCSAWSTCRRLRNNPLPTADGWGDRLL
jgi:hypothetical protein